MKLEVVSVGYFLGTLRSADITLVDSDDETTEEIMASNQDIFELIQRIKADQDAMRAETGKMNTNITKELNGMNAKLEQVKIDAIEVKSKVDSIENRLFALESENVDKKKEEAIKKKKETEKEKLSTDDKVTKENSKEKSYAKVLGGQPAGRIQPEVEVEEIRFKSTWARQISQANLEQQLKMATDAAKRMEDEGEDKHVAKKAPIKVNKLGNSLDRHDPTDWAWNENDEEWEGTTDRKARNLEKKRKDTEKKRIIIEKAAYIGRCTIGVGPIRQESISYFNKITADYGLAKRMAAAEFLQGYLKFDDSDLSDIDITDTKMSAKGDSIMYIVLDCPEKVVNIRKRLADCQNEAVKTREFIPPQFFDRYTALARYASELREKKPDVKTQIRFLDNDIGLFTKIRGSMLPFLPVNMRELEEECKLPDIDTKAEWKRKNDLPPWRRTSPTNKQVKLKSLAGVSNTAAAGMEDKEPIKNTTSKSLKHKQKKLKGSESIQGDSSTPGSSSSSDDETPTTRKEKNVDRMETSA